MKKKIYDLLFTIWYWPGYIMGVWIEKWHKKIEKKSKKSRKVSAIETFFITLIVFCSYIGGMIQILSEKGESEEKTENYV